MSTKLYVERRRGLRRVPFWASPQTMLSLVTLRESYSALVGREVSTTLIIRRALEVLSKRLERANSETELAALMRHVR